MKYYCGMQYYDDDTKKQTKSSEIKFADKHNHSAQVTRTGRIALTI
ncbi:hypothetical protein ACVJMZ_000039 [Sinorhizobium medicae]